MAVEPLQQGSGRETRLLVLVVVVALAVLLLLARFRFPTSDLAVVAPTPGPLAGLAARAAFDDMAGTLRTLLARTAPFLIPVILEPDTEGGRGRAGASGQARAAEPRIAAALRVRADLALVHVPSGLTPASGVGGAAVVVVSTDPVREVALIRVAPGEAEWIEPAADTALGLQYVGAFGATPMGITVQPLFLGRVEAQPDARWPGPLLLLGNLVGPPAGVFLFSIDGRLLGLTTEHAAGTAIVPPVALKDVVGELAAKGSV